MSQQFKINNNVLETTIREAFHSAGKMLRWGFIDEGIGLNEEIIFKALDNHLELVVMLVEDSLRYWMPWETLNKILSEKNTLYEVKGVRLRVLPKSYFKVLE